MSGIDHEWRKRKVLYDVLSKMDNAEEFEAIFEGFAGNKKLVASMVEIEGVAYLKYASPKLTADKVFMSELVERRGGHVLQFCSDELKSDKDFVLSVIEQNWSSFQFASESLKSDREVVVAAVTKFGRAIEHADDAFKQDREVAKIAVENDRFALPYFSKEIQLDPEIGIKALGENNSTGLLKNLHPDVQNCKEAVFAASGVDDEALRWASVELHKDKEFVLSCFKRQYEATGYVSTNDIYCNEIYEIIKDKNPVKALESHIAHEKLQSSLAQKAPAPKQVSGLKL